LREKKGTKFCGGGRELPFRRKRPGKEKRCEKGFQKSNHKRKTLHERKRGRRQRETGGVE